MDWVDRKVLLERIKEGFLRHPDLYDKVMRQMAPDEALGGLNTGLPAILLPDVIVAKDKPRAKKKELTQTTLKGHLKR